MTHYRWKMIVLGFIATIITYLDRSALYYAIHPMQLTYGLTNFDFGCIAAAFGVGYMLMTVIGGVLVDRYGARYSGQAQHWFGLWRVRAWDWPQDL